MRNVHCVLCRGWVSNRRFLTLMAINHGEDWPVPGPCSGAGARAKVSPLVDVMCGVLQKHIAWVGTVGG